MRIAVVGGGWAGLAAAVAAAEAGHDVTLLEAARSLGGRARRVALPGADGAALLLDNGQHILIGAYTDCLRLMGTVGVDPRDAFVRLPLALRFADGSGLQWPDIAPPWDALLGIARARGWSWRERLALLGRAQTWQRRRFACAPEVSVAALCEGLPPRLLGEFIEPLCVAALNTPAAEASGQVFLRILRDSL
ncbi:MAG: FAD-dependent oxidoreductase, partial [Giesbergeria sp.]